MKIQAINLSSNHLGILILIKLYKKISRKLIKVVFLSVVDF